MPLDFSTARQNMIEGQIRPNKVTDPRLLDCLQSLPRELFVRAEQKGFAYAEHEVEAAAGRMLMAPMLLARMIEALDLMPHMNVLDVAPATGYSSAVLAGVCKTVVGLEADAGLATLAAQICERAGITNAQFVHGPISMGAKNLAPYDAIFVNGAVVDVPRTLFNQLAEGGRLVAIVGGQPGISPGKVNLFTKFHGTVSERVLFEAAASYVPGFTPHEEFSL
ncbi:MAG: protein-L-isoaspartate O-methyltransferase [Bdellovibrionales bacterium]